MSKNTKYLLVNKLKGLFIGLMVPIFISCATLIYAVLTFEKATLSVVGSEYRLERIIDVSFPIFPISIISGALIGLLFGMKKIK